MKRHDTMKPRTKIASAEAPDGTVLELFEHDGNHEIAIKGAGLIGTRQHHSEEELARHACTDLPEKAVVMIGGLGIGFTLRAALDLLPPSGRVIQVELLQEIVDWNRDLLAHHAERPLDDPRTEIVVGDVAESIRACDGTLDAIMLDIDNGSTPMVMTQNAWLYTRPGLVALRRALVPGGRVAIWSAADDPRFASRLKKQGFRVEQHEAHARPRRRGARHCVIVGTRPAGPS